jgi:hypothetical protein
MVKFLVFGGERGLAWPVSSACRALYSCEFAGKETVGEAGLFRSAARGQQIGCALAAVGRLLVDDLDEARMGRGAQKRVEPPEADAQRPAVARWDASGAASSWRRRRKSRSSSGRVMFGHGGLRIRFVHG